MHYQVQCPLQAQVEQVEQEDQVEQQVQVVYHLIILEYPRNP